MLLVTIILIILLSLALIKVIVKGKFFDCKIKTELVLVRFYNADMPESRKIVISMNGVGAVLSGIK